MNNQVIQKMQILKEYSASKFPVLSIYLGYPEKKAPSAEKLVSQFHSLIHQNLNKEAQKKFKNDLGRIEEYLKQTYDSHGIRTTAFFSARDKLWEVLDFEFFLQPKINIAKTPNIQPIDQAINKYKKYLVLLVDREKARLFTVHFGKIEEHTDIFNGIVPQRVKAKKVDFTRDDKIFRHIENHLHRHLQLLAQKTTEFAKNKNIQFILIGGHPEILEKIKKHLLYPLNKKVIGKFVTELNIPINTIFLKSKLVVQNLEKGKQLKKA